VCNRSPNRFGSLRSCRRACSERRTPYRRCYDEVLFTSCSRDDVKHTWWFHYAGRCRKWDFQGGECPVAGSAVYKTRLECLGNCSSPYALGRRCSPPQSTTCHTKQLRFPYFAVTLAGGRLACVKASVDSLLTHRCLAGVNRFDSLSGCYRACGRRTHEGLDVEPLH
ncbi:serine proteinase inhibitor, putative, partial [Ixodes scapularis]